MLRSGLLWMSLYQHWCAGIVSHCLELKHVFCLWLDWFFIATACEVCRKKRKKREKRREKKRERPTEGFIARSVFWPVGVYAPTQISKRARCYGCPFLLEFVLFACLVRYLGVYSLSTLQYVRTVCLCVITRARTYENLITFKRNKSTYIDREVDRHIGRQID